MVHNVNLVIIGVSVGLAVGTLIALLVFISIRWYKRHSHLRRSADNGSPLGLPVHKSGVDSRNILSESIKNSETLKHASYPAKHSPLTNGKERVVPVSGLLKYSYKYVFL